MNISLLFRFCLLSLGGPLFSQLTSSFGTPTPTVVKDAVVAAPPSPVYRFVPEVGFSKYHKVSYAPKLDVEVSDLPAASVQYAEPPVVPAATYGVPN